MRQSSKASSPVVEPEMPIFGSSLDTSKPGASDSTRNAEIPECAGLGVGLREDGVEARHARVRDEALRPVEDVLVALTARGGAHRGRVGARPGLGERVRGQPLARREPRQIALLLLLRAGELEPERAELLHREDQPARRADLRDLLDRDEREQRPGAEPSVLLGEEEPEDVVLAEQLDDVPRELVRLVDLGGARRDPLARELPHEVAQLALLAVQDIPGHGRKANARGSRSPASRPGRGAAAPTRAAAAAG